MEDLNLICWNDGSWSKGDKRKPSSHIFDLHKAIAPAGQVSWYDPGVGTGFFRLSGGALGWGVHCNVLQTYRWISQNWRDGARLHLGGWSRGGEQIRLLGGMLQNSGLAHDSRDTGRAWEAYRSRRIPRFRRREINISSMICFDTVDAYFSPLRPRFHNYRAPAILQAGFHLIAIDERRRAFEQYPWIGNQIETLHFAGDHGDIGGGRSGGLADITFLKAGEWMQAQGIRLKADWAEGLNPDPNAEIGEASGIWKILGLQDRSFSPSALAHPSVFERAGYPAKRRFSPAS